VLCATDRLAIGALHAVAQAGLRAGRDISLIGFDDLPMASCTDPPLTTIEQRIDTAGARMVEMLLQLLGGADPAGLREIWSARLIPRGSDGPAPRATRALALPEGAGGRGPMRTVVARISSPSNSCPHGEREFTEGRSP
jgi:ABC-type sugar transport system substrate-binding protein